MNSIKIATFNVENLFARFQFNRNIKNFEKIRVEGWTTSKVYFTINNESSKKITGMTINALDADVIALQEVEDLDTLKKFRTMYLGGRKSYPYTVILDGNDPRRIDVAIISRYPIVNINTYAHLWSSEIGWYLFSRDCLVADIIAPGNFKITLFVNHFKSMLDRKDPVNGRRNTKLKRYIQSQTVKDIVMNKFGDNPGSNPFIILGDFNDYIGSDEQGDSGIEDLIEWNQIENIVKRLPEDEQWTHYFKGNSSVPEAYRQLDYILLSKVLAEKNKRAPIIERRGMPKRAYKYSGERFPNVGKNSPKASDHCPVVVELQYG